MFQCFTKVAEHEGPNLRSRAEKWSARYSTKIRPGQSSAAQAQAACLVRILCVAREGAYETLHEPPTADPHGGWCGVWELETPGYPIRPQSPPVSGVHWNSMDVDTTVPRQTDCH